jgi:nucleotide-binding universal stress UspA family protein
MRVLAPLDGSDAGYQALDRGLAMLEGARLELTLLHVRAIAPEIQAGAIAAIGPPSLGLAPQLVVTEQESRDILARGIDIARRHGVRAMARGQEGGAQAVILDEAAHHDLLLMHHLGASRLGDALRGHAAERLAREAPCAVLLVGPAP